MNGNTNLVSNAQCNDDILFTSRITVVCHNPS